MEKYVSWVCKGDEKMEEKQNLKNLENRIAQLEYEAKELKVIIAQLQEKERNLNEQPMEKETPLQKKENENKEIVDNVSRSQHQPSHKQIKTDTIDWEKQIGQVWLPRVFIFVLLVGILWAFKAASDFGLINEPVKVMFGYIAACFLLYVGFKQIQHKRKALGQVLLGGSFVLFMMTTFAMHVLYGMVPIYIAFSLNIIWLVGGLYLAHMIQAESLAVISAIGGYLIPFLVVSASPNVVTFVSFETILYLSFLLFALMKRYTVLYQVSFWFLHLTLFVTSLLMFSSNLEVYAVVIFIQHLFILTVYLVSSIFVKQQISFLFVSFGFALMWAKIAFNTSVYEWILLCLSVGYVVLSLYAWFRKQEKRAALLVLATFSFLFFLLQYFTLEHILGLLIIQGLVSLYFGIISKSVLQQIGGWFVYSFASITTFFTLFDRLLSIEFLNWLCLLGSLYVLLYYLFKLPWVREKNRYSLSQVITVISLVVLVVFITNIVDVVMTPYPIHYYYMAVSFAWGLCSLASIILGSKLKNKSIRVFGLSLLFITVAKLIFIDLYILSIFVRAVLFIGLGLIGIVVSRLYYKGSK